MLLSRLKFVAAPERPPAWDGEALRAMVPAFGLGTRKDSPVKL